MKERKIVEYVVLIKSTSERLKDTVNMKLLDDWQPLGGVSTLIKPNNGVYFIQALVKYEESQEEEL
mgnify:CR=1 FL=1